MLKYEEILLEVLLDQLSEPTKHINVSMLTDSMKKTCPGNYKIVHNKKSNINTSQLIDMLKLEFDSPEEKVEWLLKYS